MRTSRSTGIRAVRRSPRQITRPAAVPPGPVALFAVLVLAPVFALLPTGAGWTLAAQVPHTEHTVLLAPEAASPPARIADFAFMQGRWVGEGMGGDVDELWSRPAGGTMVGAFRLLQQGRVVFYELLVLEEEAETVVMRIKHFNPGPGLPGWEERDRETLFRLVRVAPDTAWFHGLTLRREGPDALLIHLALRSADGTVREEAFHLRRAPG